MKKTIICLVIGLITGIGFSQENNDKKISESAALNQQDSIKMAAQNKRKAMMERFKSMAMYPVIDAGPFSGVVPVEDLTEIPDPNLEYKLMFELVKKNIDSVSGINQDLVEVARVVNLHVASGIPMENISLVIVVHGPALKGFTTDTYYNENFKKDNPNIKIINDLDALGAKFIACGQAMFIHGIDKEALLPVFKVSLTAQTILSSYQLKGYVKYW